MAIIPQISSFDFQEIEFLGDLERFHLALADIKVVHSPAISASINWANENS